VQATQVQASAGSRNPVLFLRKQGPSTNEISSLHSLPPSFLPLPSQGQAPAGIQSCSRAACASGSGQQESSNNVNIYKDIFRFLLTQE